MRSRSSTSGLVALSGASILWAFSFGLIATHLKGVDSYVVAFIRLGLSLLLFLPLLRVRRLTPWLAIQLAGIGAIQYGVMYVAYIRSYQYLSGHHVALFTIFTPLYVALIHGVGRRQLERRVVIAALLAVAGAGFIVFRMPDRNVALKGIGLLQVANLAFAFGQVAYRRIRKQMPSGLHDRDVFGLLFAGGAVLAAVVSAAGGGWSGLDLSSRQIIVLLYLGLVPSGIGFFLWNRGACLVAPGTLAAMNNIKIPLAVIATIVLFHEQADMVRLLAGGVVMLVAVWWSERGG